MLLVCILVVSLVLWFLLLLLLSWLMLLLLLLLLNDTDAHDGRFAIGISLFDRVLCPSLLVLVLRVLYLQQVSSFNVENPGHMTSPELIFSCWKQEHNNEDCTPSFTTSAVLST